MAKRSSRSGGWKYAVFGGFFFSRHAYRFFLGGGGGTNVVGIWNSPRFGVTQPSSAAKIPSYSTSICWTVSIIVIIITTSQTKILSIQTAAAAAKGKPIEKILKIGDGEVFFLRKLCLRWTKRNERTVGLKGEYWWGPFRKVLNNYRTVECYHTCLTEKVSKWHAEV